MKKYLFLITLFILFPLLTKAETINLKCVCFEYVDYGTEPYATKIENCEKKITTLKLL